MTATQTIGNRFELLLEPESARAETTESRSRNASWLGSWYSKYRLLVLVTDACVIAFTMVMSYIVRFGRDLDASTFGMAAGLVIGTVWFVSLTESRGRKIVGSGTDEYRRVVNASLLSFGLVAIVSYLAMAEISRFYFAMALPLGMVLLVISRWLCRVYLHQQRLAGEAMTRVLVVGTKHEIVDAVRQLRRRPAAGFLPVAYSLVGDAEPGLELRGLTRVRIDCLRRHAAGGNVGAVLVAGGLNRHETRELAWRLEPSEVELLFVPGIVDVASPRIHVRTIEGVDLMQVDLPRHGGWRRSLKRTFDIAFSAAALVMLSPILAVIALLIKLEDGGPVLFKQERVGRSGQPFTIHKFRSMAVDAEKRKAELASSLGNGALFKLDHDPRVTRVGRVLRKYSLDELPQFWTSLRGDMSVVGPRPHLAKELLEYPDAGLRRLLTKPGITGLWQVSGRSDLSLEESVRLDLRYVENWSLAGDLAIVMKTVTAVIRPSGAY